MLIRDILNLKGGAIYDIDAASRLADAVGLMVRHDIGSLVVTEQGSMVACSLFAKC